MAEKTTVRAPYNFVPFANKYITRYADLSALPQHNTLSLTLKTGEIRVTLRAETPVFVSDGKGREAHFFRNAAGKVAIPGSTVRGMVRENMQILGFGLIRPGEDMQDHQIYFRDMASAKAGTGNKLKEYYHEALGIKTEKTPEGKSVAVPQRVQAGYLHHTDEGYYIQPIQGEVLRVSRSTSIAQEEKLPRTQAKRPEDARAVTVYYRAGEKRVEYIAAKPSFGLQKGELLYTGRPVGAKSNALYLFPPEDESVAPIWISEEDVLSYEEDFETRRNSLGAYYDVSFWKLPEKGDRKAVFYIRHEGHTYFGRTRFLRIGYRYPLSSGLPSQHRKAQQEQKQVIDYPSAILGFVRGQTAYRSRVSVSDFTLQGEPRELRPFSTVLGEPKPSYYPGYVAEGKHYNMPDFQLRGYKQYWLRKASAPSTDKPSVASTLRPLAEGSIFSGVIRYKNLTEDELGLLLWSLRLEDGCFQTIGMGKPYGYGRMRLTIDALCEYDLETLYTPEGLCSGAVAAPADKVEQYIRAYDRYAVGQLRVGIKSLCEDGGIQDFFFLKRTVREVEEVSYMALEEYKTVRQGLERTEEVREAFARREKEKNRTPEESMQALLEKYGSRHKKQQESSKRKK